MARLADLDALRAHRSRFDATALPRGGLDPLDVRRLDGLCAQPYEDLSATDVTYVLDLVARAGHPPALFAYFLPAVLRRPPLRDRLAAERLLAALGAARGDARVNAWGPEIEETLAGWLAVRPLRGGDDPVDLWLGDTALHRFELAAARRLAGSPRGRPGITADWTRAEEGPIYARAALALFQRSPASAERRFLLWETTSEDNAARSWIEVMFHVHGEGWRPEPTPLDRLLDDPARLAVADGLVAHPEPDVAVGAAAVVVLLAPRRAREVRGRIEARLAALDAAADDRFVLVPTVRRLLGVA